MKSIAKRCPDCGVLTNPFTIHIVEDAWITRGKNEKNEDIDIAHFEYKCPHCLKVIEIKMLWVETLH